MSKPKFKDRTPGRCRFCNEPGVTKEHIWNRWVQKLIPVGGSRTESVITNSSPGSGANASKFSYKKRQGSVHTKQSRKFCSTCNSGWMGLIGEAAKPIAAKLIKGEQIVLRHSEHRALAAWLGLSAIVADLQTQYPYKIPDSDLSYMFSNKSPPLHWYIGIGYYATENPQVVCNHAYDKISQSDSAEPIQVIRAITTILGHLYSCTVIHSPPAEMGVVVDVANLHAPHLTPVWPYAPPATSYPPSPALVITGELAVGGGPAWDLSQRCVQEVAKAVHRFNASRGL
jgi:hypothetical protein